MRLGKFGRMLLRGGVYALAAFGLLCIFMITLLATEVLNLQHVDVFIRWVQYAGAWILGIYGSSVAAALLRQLYLQIAAYQQEQADRLARERTKELLSELIPDVLKATLPTVLAELLPAVQAGTNRPEKETPRPEA